MSTVARTERKLRVLSRTGEEDDPDDVYGNEPRHTTIPGPTK